MADIAFIVLSFACVILNIVPFVWQVRHGNSGPICLIIWTLLMNLNNFVNSVVWRNDAINRAPIWCDISVKLYMGGTVGILAANLCITRFLARVIKPNGSVITSRDRRNRAIFDYCFSFGTAVFVMATHVFYQSSRFSLRRGAGPVPIVINSWPTYLLYWPWLPLFSFVAALYAAYSIYQLLRHRLNFSKLLAKTDSALTTSRFLRLSMLSAIYAFFNLPLTIYVFVQQVKISKYTPYRFRSVYSGNHVIRFVPFETHKTIGDYTFIIAGLLVFVFFGLSKETLSLYPAAGRWAMSLFSRKSKTMHLKAVKPPVEVQLTEADTNQMQNMSYPQKQHWDSDSDEAKPEYDGPFAHALESGTPSRLRVEVTRHDSVV